ncbi:carboxypeptidase-like regulatory domain-containing protein [Nostoc sp.]|uniref:carboxypeptidase-like regulatory domain-containing protein n=1 Tax=Nostoc sp. TaxID=1180 RepID=UPI002FF7CE0A
MIADSCTPVMIPLIRSNTRSEVVTDTQGQAIVGARVEAIQPDRETKRFFVTNGAGVYYLEDLLQGKYNCQSPKILPKNKFSQIICTLSMQNRKSLFPPAPCHLQELRSK